MEVVEGAATVEDVTDFVDWLDDVATRHGVVAQTFDARYVVDREHLEHAVELADRAFKRGDAVARERAVEILLYAAGRRQIQRALAMGVSEGENEVVVVVHDPTGEGDRRESNESEAAAADEVADRLDRASTLGEYDPALVREFFDIGEAELAATDGDLSDLVRERVALLTVEK